MLFGSNKLVGLDIGTSSIKLVEVETSRKGVQLTTFAFIPTPPGAIAAGEILNPEALSDAVKHLVAQTRTRRKKVVQPAKHIERQKVVMEYHDANHQ